MSTAEAPTLSATSGVVTGANPNPLTVVAGAPAALAVNGLTNKNGKVILACGAPAASRTCTQSSPVSTGTGRFLTATFGLIDLWGNAAKATTSTTVTLKSGGGTVGTYPIAAGSTDTSPFTFNLPDNGGAMNVTVSTPTFTLAVNGIG